MSSAGCPCSLRGFRCRSRRRSELLLPAKERAIFWQAYGRPDDHTRARARGWALSLALVFLMHSADNPLIAGIGKHTFREVRR